MAIDVASAASKAASGEMHAQGARVYTPSRTADGTSPASNRKVRSRAQGARGVCKGGCLRRPGTELGCATGSAEWQWIAVGVDHTLRLHTERVTITLARVTDARARR